MKTISILWWKWLFGKWIEKQINKNFPNNKIILTWKWDDNISAVKNADIIIFSIPISETVAVIKEVWDYIPAWAIVLDITSVKNEPCKAMQKYIGKKATIIPTHPMFWPFFDDINWQVIVMTPKSNVKKNKNYLFLKKILEEKWANIVETTPINHDKSMAIVQWLTHFVLFVMWETIRRFKSDLSEINKLSSPIYKIMFASIGRYLDQNPNLYAEIQCSNKEIINMHKIFSCVTSDFSKFIKNKNKNWFVKSIQKTSEFFGDYTAQWQKYTDSIINFLSQIKNKTEND